MIAASAGAGVLRLDVQLVRFCLDHVVIWLLLAWPAWQRPFAAVTFQRLARLGGRGLVGGHNGANSAHRHIVACLWLAHS
jgi:hypothetical protein